MIRSDIRIQFFWYLVVGGSAFLVDIVAFWALTRVGLPWLPASVASFIVATVSNYVLSYHLAFTRGRFNRTGEMSRLFLVALVGLLLNTLIVWSVIELAVLEPVIAKIAAVPLVLVWNFLGRRFFVFHRDLPKAIFDLSRNVVGHMDGKSRE